MNILKKTLQSKLASNIFNQMILYGFSHLIPFFLMPFLLSTIGVERYGLIYFALAFATYFQVINEFGFDLSNVRHVVKNKDNCIELSRIFSAIIHSKLYLIIGTFIFYNCIIFTLPNFREHISFYLLAFARLFGVVISPNWFFRSMEDVKYITRISLIIKIICILPIFIIVHTPDDAIWVMIFFAIETFAGGFTGIYVAVRRYKIRLSFVRNKDVIFFLKDSFPFFASTFITRIYQNSNIVILGFFCNELVTGLYAASEKLFRAYSAFVSPLITYIFYPYFQRTRDFMKINRMVFFIIVLNVFIITMLFVFGDILLPLFIKNNTEEIIQFFNWFLLLLVICVPNDILGFPYLGVMGYVKQVNLSTFISGVIYIVLCAIAILLDMVNPLHLILILIATNLASALIRGRYIAKYHSILSNTNMHKNGRFL